MNVQRNLICIFTPSDTILPHYIKLLEAFNGNVDYETPFPDMLNVSKKYLELYLKKVNVFSSFVHNINPTEVNNKQNEFYVRGPFVTSFVKCRDLD